MVSLPSFNHYIRRQMSSRSSHAADENSPLIANGGASSALQDTLGHVHGNGNGNGHISLSRGSSTMTFLFDSKHTPGLDNQNFALRHLAYSWHVTKVTLLSSYVNFLLVMVPIGIVAGKLGWNSTAVFTINFFAIIPLAAVLSFATEEISLKLGETMGGLLNATFGNAVELIVSIVALKEKQIDIVQASMLGSILSNLLLVMGMCFLFGGMIHRGQTGNGTEQVFSSATAQTTCSLMTLSSASLIIPAALYAVLDQGGSRDKDQSILTLSRGTAIILLLLYVLYLVFQLRTHSNLFDAENQNAGGEGEEPEEPTLGTVSAVAVLVVTTILVAICADYLVGSIDNLVETSGISRAFIGLILIPIVGNAAEHVTAVVVAVRDKMDLAMGVAIGSSIQIALLVTPFLVIVGWIIGSDMSLHFETFQTVAFSVSVLVVTYTVQDGKSNYLEGAMLLGLYAIIALAFLVTPSGIIDGKIGA
ncbi:Vacuolar calcium ion transporter [Fusarium solani]|nr:Vacuolar calcium ion transporter [Fusarium solani]